MARREEGEYSTYLTDEQRRQRGSGDGSAARTTELFRPGPYAQRASAGLIITEGTSPNGLGHARIPGLYSAAQAAGWRQVTDAVHAAGGKIVVQLMHTGRVGHPLNLPAGARIVAPSAVGAPGTMWTDSQAEWATRITRPTKET